MEQHRSAIARLIPAVVALIALSVMATFPNRLLAGPPRGPNSFRPSVDLGPTAVESPGDRSVPAAAIPPRGRGCDGSWSYVDDPVVHYWFCYPASRGFWRSSPQAVPLTRLSFTYLEDLHLVGP